MENMMMRRQKEKEVKSSPKEERRSPATIKWSAEKRKEMKEKTMRKSGDATEMGEEPVREETLRAGGEPSVGKEQCACREPSDPAWVKPNHARRGGKFKRRETQPANMRIQATAEVPGGGREWVARKSSAEYGEEECARAQSNQTGQRVPNHGVSARHERNL